MWIQHILLTVLWTVYCLLHSVLATTSLKRRLKEKIGKNFKFYRPAYVLFSFLFLAGIIYFQVSMPDVELFRLTTSIILAGIVICFSGLVMMIVCIQKYFIRLSGLRSLFSENRPSQLMIAGIHRYVRHPLYLGTFVFIWGLLLLLPYLGLLISNTIITVYTLIGIRLEENKLLEEYGDNYREYRKKVPMLLPFFKPGR